VAAAVRCAGSASPRHCRSPQVTDSGRLLAPHTPSEGRVRHDVQGERCDIARPAAAPDREGRAKLLPALDEGVAEQRRRGRCPTSLPSFGFPRRSHDFAKR
jgi:hypothetical protein